MFTLFAQAENSPLNIDTAVASIMSILDEVAKDTPWLTEISFLNNELWKWLALLMTVAVMMAIGRLISFGLNRAGTQAENRAQKILAVVLTSLAGSIAAIAFSLGLAIGIKFLAMPASIANKVSGVAIACSLGLAAYNMVSVVDCWLRSFSSRTSSRLDDMLAPLVTKSIRATVIILVLVQLVQTITDTAPASLIASLGVGGLAIGLAAQDTIKNIFGSVMIFSDRPFELGDEISVDGNTGVVETVGFRSTRFRTGNGHVITIPNGDLANKAITNVSRRRNLSRTLTLPLPSDASSQQLEQALAMLKDILANHEGMLPSMPPKVMFSEITPTALNLQAQYWFHPPDGNRFSQLNERVNLEIVRRFQAAGITLAVPTQRVELEKAA